VVVVVKPDLRIVQSGDAPPAPLSLVDAVERGDYLEILRAQRRDIAACLPDEKGPAKAALHRQLSLIAKEIELLESQPDVEAGSHAEVVDGEFDASAV
jgi:hypothetical protein